MSSFNKSRKGDVFKVKLFYDDKWHDAYGDFSKEQVDKIFEQMKRPKNKRLYIMGIDFSSIDKVEVNKL